MKTEDLEDAIELASDRNRLLGQREIIARCVGVDVTVHMKGNSVKDPGHRPGRANRVLGVNNFRQALTLTEQLLPIMAILRKQTDVELTNVDKQLALLGVEIPANNRDILP